MVVFFFILSVSTVALSFYDFAGRESQSILTRWSTKLVDSTAAIVDGTINRWVFEGRLIDEAMSAFVKGHPEHAELSSLLNREINKCNKGEAGPLYCMRYHTDTRDLDMGTLPSAIPMTQDISLRLQNMQGCYINGNPFELCLFEAR